MHKAGTFFVSAALLSLALLLPRHAVADWATDPQVNVPLCTAAGDQQHPQVASDGSGGAIVAWQDNRGGITADIYAQRVSAGGTVQWVANGVALCTAADDQELPMIVSDGEGGVIVVWQDYRNGTDYDIYAQRISADGAPQWAADGVALCTAIGDQQVPTIASDGAGGAIISWRDARSGNYDIYAQRISAIGTVQWTINGVALGTASGDQQPPVMVSDSAGGGIVVWLGTPSGSAASVVAQRISADGVCQWTPTGVTLSSTAYVAWTPAVAADGAGGAIFAWGDLRYMTCYINSQRIAANGTVQWTPGGLQVTGGGQHNPRVVSDGSGGAVVAYFDYSGNGTRVRRITAGGTLQWPGTIVLAGQIDFPPIVSDGAGGAIVATDGTNISAGRVSADGSVMWTSLNICTAPGTQNAARMLADGAGGAIVAWQDYRNVDSDIYAQRIQSDGRLGTPDQTDITSVSDVPNDQGGHVRVTWNASALDTDPLWGISYYRVYRRYGNDWGPVADVVPEAASNYSCVVHTSADSVPGQPLPWTVFKVEAVTPDDLIYTSAADSGYSVDNLAPQAPSPFTGEYLNGTTRLHWPANAAADFFRFRLYRGQDVDFVPGSSNLVVTKADTGYVDAVGAPYYYKLCAVDVHENASGFTLLQPSGTADVPETSPLALVLEGVQPNPSQGARLSVAFALPAATPARLELLDVSGRRVLEREVGSLGVGQHTFDLGQSQRLAPGLYLVRLTQGANTRTTRVAVLR